MTRTRCPACRYTLHILGSDGHPLARIRAGNRDRLRQQARGLARAFGWQGVTYIEGDRQCR